MSRPTFINDEIRDAIAGMIGRGFLDLEMYLIRNNIRLYRSPTPENGDPAAANFEDFREWATGIQSPEPDHAGNPGTFPLPDVFPVRRRVPEGQPTPVQQTPPPNPLPDNELSPFDFGVEHPIDNEIVPPSVPTPNQQTPPTNPPPDNELSPFDFGEDHPMDNDIVPPSTPTGVPQPGDFDLGDSTDLPVLEPLASTPENNAIYFQTNFVFISNLWQAEPIDEDQIAQQTFDLHDWVLRQPREDPTRTRYIQAYRDATQQLGLQSLLNVVPMERNAENFRVLNQTLMIIENQNSVQRLRDATIASTQGGTTGQGTGTNPDTQPGSRRRKRDVSSDGDDDDDDDDGRVPPPPKRRRRDESQEASDGDDESTDDPPATGKPGKKNKGPPKKRGRKIQETNNPALAEQRRKLREAKAKSRKLAKERAEAKRKEEMERGNANTQTTVPPPPPGQGVYFPGPVNPMPYPQPTVPPGQGVYFPGPVNPTPYQQPTGHPAPPGQPVGYPGGFILTNPQPDQAQNPGWLDPALVNLINGLPDPPPQQPRGHGLRPRRHRS